MAKSVSSSVSSASKSASVSAASAASVASKSLASASAKASAAAADAIGQGGRSTTLTLITAIAIVVTVLAVAIGGLYFSGYADDIMVYYAKKFYEGKAKAEMLAMQNLGEGKAKDLIKGKLLETPKVWLILQTANSMNRSAQEESTSW